MAARCFCPFRLNGNSPASIMCDLCPFFFFFFFFIDIVSWLSLLICSDLSVFSVPPRNNDGCPYVPGFLL